VAQNQYELEQLWVKGKLPTVDLRFGDKVRATSGQNAGKSGRVVALLSTDPVPYHVIEQVEGTSFNATRSELERV
jgi:ribosomal protein L24